MDLVHRFSAPITILFWLYGRRSEPIFSEQMPKSPAHLSLAREIDLISTESFKRISETLNVLVSNRDVIFDLDKWVS